MDIVTRSVGFEENSTIDDLFQLFADCAMSDLSERDYLVIKNAFYMGVNGVLAVLDSATSQEDFIKKYQETAALFQVYEAGLRPLS